MRISSSDFIAPSDFIAIMRECFEGGSELTFTPTGSSMLPMLDGRSDTVTFAPKPDRLKKYDVAFYIRRRTNQLVLHRVVGFDTDGGYIFSGDGQYYYEHGIEDGDILALMVAFTHKGKKYRVTDLSYRIYIRFMMTKKRLHIVCRKIYRRLRGRK